MTSKITYKIEAKMLAYNLLKILLQKNITFFKPKFKVRQNQFTYNFFRGDYMQMKLYRESINMYFIDV